MFCPTPDAKEATSGARKPATVSGTLVAADNGTFGVCPDNVATADWLTFAEYPELVSAFSHCATDSLKLTNRIAPAAQNRHSPRVNASLTNSVNSKP
ncbi:unnamed protein product [Sphagnum jensenii]